MDDALDEIAQPCDCSSSWRWLVRVVVIFLVIIVLMCIHLGTRIKSQRIVEKECVELRAKLAALESSTPAALEPAAGGDTEAKKNK